MGFEEPEGSRICESLFIVGWLAATFREIIVFNIIYIMRSMNSPNTGTTNAV